MQNNLNKNPKDKFARIIAVLSLITSMLAIIVPYIQNEKKLNEKISANYQLYLDSSKHIFVYKEPLIFGRTLYIPFKLNISNTGNINTSIIKIRTNGYNPLFTPEKDKSGYNIQSYPINLSSGIALTTDIFIKMEIRNIYEKQIIDRFTTKDNTLKINLYDDLETLMSYPEFPGDSLNAKNILKRWNNLSPHIECITSRGQIIEVQRGLPVLIE